MRIPIKDEKGIQGMRAAGKVSARVLRDVAKMVQPGVTTLEIDQYAKERMDYYGGKSAFYNYHGFPGQICISVNDVIIHGIGSAFQRLVLGDIVSLDVGVLFEGYIGDNAMTVPAGGCSMDAQELLNVTDTALK